MKKTRFLKEIDLTGIKIENVGQPQTAGDAVNLEYLESIINASDFQNSIKGLQIDNTLVPELIEGYRYIITDKDNLNAQFGTIPLLENDDIVTYTGTAFEVTVDISENTSTFILLWNEGDNKYYSYTQEEGWKVAEGLIDIVWGAGLKRNVDTISVDVDNETIEISNNKVKTTNKIAKRATVTIGNGTEDNFTIQHNLNTTQIGVFVKEISSNSLVETAVQIIDSNNCKISFNTIPEENSFEVLILG